MAGLAARTSAWAPAPSSCVGPSTCDRFTSALVAGQRVLSYTYYTPWGAKRGWTKQNSRPNDRSSVRYTELLTTLATSAVSVSSTQAGGCESTTPSPRKNTAAWASMCALFCSHPHVDLCDTNILPSVGNLNTHFTIGRFWRF